MITTTPFSLAHAPLERVFFVLDAIPRFTTEVGVWINTPSGVQPVDFVDVNVLPDGTLVASWSDAIATLPLHNLVVQAGDQTQIINLCQLERVVQHYDRPTNSTFGTFSFTDSLHIAPNDWRCHQGRFGPWQFSDDQHEEVLNAVSEILVYETFLSVNGTAHLVYVEATNKEGIAFQKINNSIAPASGRTLQETLRLIYEWSTVAQEPFNCTDRAAVAARDFLIQLNFGSDELEILDQLQPMQIAEFIKNNPHARVRPENVPPITSGIARMLFKRMSSLSLAALMRTHNIVLDQPFDHDTLLREDQRRLYLATQKFRDEYEIDSTIPITDEEAVMRKAVQNYPEYKAFIANKLTLLLGRREVLNRVSDGTLF